MLSTASEAGKSMFLTLQKDKKNLHHASFSWEGDPGKS